MKKKEMNPPDPDDFDCVKACSAQDLTGLIPSGPVDEKELLDYEELYSFLPRAAKGQKEDPQ